MSEAETSLRLAFYLLQAGHAAAVDVAIDGAQVRTGDTVHFAIAPFLLEAGCHCRQQAREWRGTYDHAATSGVIRLHSNPGQGDVVARLHDGRTFRAESKKGTLQPSRSSQEYPLLREALGQLLTIEVVGATDVLVVAVPHSEKFAQLASRWRTAPLVQRVGIQIVTVSRTNEVNGLELLPAA